MRSLHHHQWQIVCAVAAVLTIVLSTSAAASKGVLLDTDPTVDDPWAPGDRLLAWSAGSISPARQQLGGRIEHPFDLVVLADQLPVLDGLTFQVERAGQVLDIAWPSKELPSARLNDPTGRLDEAWLAFQRARDAEADGRLASGDWQLAVKAAGDHHDVQAALLIRWAEAADNAGQLDVADQLFERAVEVFDRPPANDSMLDAVVLASALHRRGSVLLRSGQSTLAVPVIERSVDLRRRWQSDSNALRSSLNNLGVAYQNLGQLDAAEATLNEALALVRRIAPGSRREAGILNNLGSLAYERGDLALTEQHLRQAHDIRLRVEPDGLGLARSFNNLSALMEERGELETAEVWYRSALDLRRDHQAAPAELASSYQNLALLLLRRGVDGEAIELAAEADRLAKDQSAGGEHEAWAAQVLAYTLLRTSDSQPGDSADKLSLAVTSAERAVDRFQRSVPQSMAMAQAFAILGEARLRTGDVERSEAAHRRALDLRMALAPGGRWEAASWSALAEIAERQGAMETAIERMLRAIDQLESSAAPPGETPGEQARSAAESVDWYRSACLWLARLGRSSDAFDLAERARARGLHARLAERRLRFDRHLPADLESERRRLAARTAAADQVLAATSKADHGTDADAARAMVTKLRDQRRQLERRIRSAAPQLAALRQPDLADLESARRQLPPTTLLLSSIVDDDETLVMALRGATLETHRLAIGRVDLEHRVGAWRALLEATTLTQPAALEATQRQMAHELYADLLTPIEPLLAQVERIVVIADGPLHRLPFAALRDADGRYLVERVALARAPSVTVALQHPWRRNIAEGSLIAFGDPHSPDQQVAEPSLAWSRFEVEALAASHLGSSRVLVAEAASKAAFQRFAQQADWLHFAGHTEVRDPFPLDSFLRLAGEGDRSGNLQAWEIYEDLRLDTALVTLSSCSSSVGPEVHGEGLLGLAQAFLFAGTEAVMASQWRVQDRPTALLMIRLEHHLRHRLTVDQALRAAQLDLLHNRAGAWPESPWPETSRSGPSTDSWWQRFASWAGLSESSPDPIELAQPSSWAGFELILGSALSTAETDKITQRDGSD